MYAKSLFSACKYSCRSEQLHRRQPFIRLLVNTNYYSQFFKMSFVTFEEVENLSNQPDAVLIDVRDPPEIKDTGIIPTSINIPCKCDSIYSVPRKSKQCI